MERGSPRRKNGARERGTGVCVYGTGDGGTMGGCLSNESGCEDDAFVPNGLSSAGFSLGLFFYSV